MEVSEIFAAPTASNTSEYQSGELAETVKMVERYAAPTDRHISEHDQSIIAGDNITDTNIPEATLLETIKIIHQRSANLSRFRPTLSRPMLYQR